MKHEPVDLAIIGAGPAGLMAAWSAVKRSRNVIVIERKARIGSKMLMTANGRCNFTKDIPVRKMLEDIGGEAAGFVAPALKSLPPSSIAGLFRSRGLAIKKMTDSRLFPASEKAADVVHIFGDMLRDKAVPLLCNAPVTGLQQMKNGFIVGLGGFTLWAKNVLVATGGMSFPKTGCFGDGYRFAESLGHTVEPCRAGLTGFELRHSRGKERFSLARASILYKGGVELCSYQGEVEFEPWGVTGAAVYNCQRLVARHGVTSFTLRLDTPSGVFEFQNPQPRPLKEAIVTIGGVKLDEVDPFTMSSRLVPGLYFAGEVLDIDGPTGGYNLTLAFATGHLAAISVK